MCEESDAAIINAFHELYYRRWQQGQRTIDVLWMGCKALKCPLDLWIYQEILFETRPDIIVETGTFAGGSALYLASLFDLFGRGDIITIDMDPQPDLPSHPRIGYIRGSSTDPNILAEVHERVGGKKAMVILDSDHRREHVLAELHHYAAFVQPGYYLIVEDTNVNGHPTLPEFGPGPMEAVEEFLRCDNRFEADRNRERFMMTLNPKGYLRRISN